MGGIITLQNSPAVAINRFKKPMQTWTIQKLLEWITDYFAQHCIEAPRLSAELLLSHVLGMRRIELYMHFDKPVAKADLDRLHGLVKRAVSHEPVQYLVGKTEFYSLEISVTSDCLIPRPETEQLAERAIEFLRGRSGHQRVCDLCTGSGCIAVAVAKNFPNSDVVATDICESALAVAAGNVEKYGLSDRVKLLQGDLFEPILPFIDERKFDLIVSNPPYITTADYEHLDKNVKGFEPAQALLAGADGLDVIRKIAEQAVDFLVPGGKILVEIGYDQGEAVRDLFGEIGVFEQIEVEKDFGGQDRLVSAVRSE